MEKSALQIARAAYQPKLPRGLKGAVKAVEGAPTQSVDNQEEIKALFPNKNSKIFWQLCYNLPNTRLKEKNI